MSERSRPEVGSLVRQRMKVCNITESRLRAAANIDRKTLGALLDGTRWPQEETRMRVETVLGWTAGSIQDLRDGRDATPLERGTVLTDNGPEDEDGREHGPLADVPTATLAEIVSEGMAELRRRLSGGHGRQWEADPNKPPL